MLDPESMNPDPKHPWMFSTFRSYTKSMELDPDPNSGIIKVMVCTGHTELVRTVFTLSVLGYLTSISVRCKRKGCFCSW
jgi:hypothetical protein